MDEFHKFVIGAFNDLPRRIEEEIIKTFKTVEVHGRELPSPLRNAIPSVLSIGIQLYSKLQNNFVIFL